MKMQAIATAVLVAAVCAAVAAAAAWSASAGAIEIAGFSAPLVAAFVCFAVNWLAFVPAAIGKTERFYDLTGSITYVVVIALCGVAGLRAHPEPLRVVVALAVVAWTLRLGSFLVGRIRRAGKDGRFDAMKEAPPRFFVAWTLQGLWVFLTSLAATTLLTSKAPLVVGVAAPVGLCIWAVGFAVEVLADAQKTLFARDSANQGRFITTGLWAWSRHPNYFGEILLWTGLFVAGTQSYVGGQWVALLSPVFVAFLLTRVSGVNLLEERADKRWGGQADYEAYKARTPVLVPRPPRT